MEKFALLNLLKAIDGLKNPQPAQNDESSSVPPPVSATNAAPLAPPEKKGNDTQNLVEMPNIMYVTLMRHEQISYRIKNKR